MVRDIRRIRRQRIRKARPGYRFSWEVFSEILDDNLRPGASWLDIGAGSNVLVREHGAGVFKIGLDRLVHFQVKADAEKNFIAADVTELPFKDGSFDLVSARFVLEHVDNIPALFAEVRRVLRPGAKFLLQTVNLGNPLVAAGRLVPRPAKRLIMKGSGEDPVAGCCPTVYGCNTPGKLRKTARGFQMEKFIACEDVITWNGLLFALTRLTSRLFGSGWANRFAGVLICLLRKA